MAEEVINATGSTSVCSLCQCESCSCCRHCCSPSQEKSQQNCCRCTPPCSCEQSKGGCDCCPCCEDCKCSPNRLKSLAEIQVNGSLSASPEPQHTCVCHDPMSECPEGHPEGKELPSEDAVISTVTVQDKGDAPAEPIRPPTPHPEKITAAPVIPNLGEEELQKEGEQGQVVTGGLEKKGKLSDETDLAPE